MKKLYKLKCLQPTQSKVTAVIKRQLLLKGLSGIHVWWKFQPIIICIIRWKEVAQRIDVIWMPATSKMERFGTIVNVFLDKYCCKVLYEIVWHKLYQFHNSLILWLITNGVMEPKDGWSVLSFWIFKM